MVFFARTWLYAALGCAAALAVPVTQRSFKSIDIAMTDSMGSLLAYMATEVFATGQTLPRAGNDHPLVAPYGLFETSDGHIAIAVSNDQIVDRLFRLLECRHLLDDPRFANNEARVQHRDEIRAEIQSRLIGQTTEVWLARLNDAGVPAGPVLDVISALNDPQIQYRNMVLESSVQKGENIPILGFPIKQSVDAPELRCPAPELGEHNHAAFCQL